MTGSVDLTLWDATDKTGGTITPSTEGNSGVYSIDVPGQWNLITFAGEAGQNVSISPSEATFIGNFAVFRPNGTELAGSGGGGVTSIHGPFILPEAGTYTIRLSANDEATGSVKLTAYLVKDLTGSITPTKEGAKQTVSITTPGQNALYSVTVKAGQSVSVKGSNANFNSTDRYYLEWLDPEGKLIASEWWWGKTGSGFWGRREFTAAGTYTLKVNPEGSMTGSLDLTLWDATDKTGGTITPSAEGGFGTYSVDVPGQWNLITFAGEVGQVVSIVPAEATFSGDFRLVKPNGTEIVGSGGGFSFIHGPFTLPEVGTYTIRLSGSGEATGSVKLSAYLVKDLTGSITPTKEGAKQTVSITAPGQNALYSVTVKAGQSVSVKGSNANFNSTDRYDLEWLDPEGKFIDEEFWFGKTGSAFWDKHREFTSAGIYLLRVDPYNAMTGSLDLTLWDATSKTGDTITPSAEGGSGTYLVDVPGQWDLITFAGEAGQTVSIAPSEPTYSGIFAVFRPNGAEISGTTGTLTALHGPFTLPETGTYTIRLRGAGEPTGSVKLAAYLVKDLTGSITPTKEGAKQTVSITQPGQNALYSVTVKAGQSVSVKGSNANFNSTDRYYLEWLDPEGKLIASEFWIGKTGSGFWGRREFTTAGTYALKVNPESSMTGSLDLTLWDASDKTGGTITPTTEGESKTVSVDVPGQRTLVTFPGTSGTTVTLKLQEATFTGVMSAWKPDGTLLSSSEKSFSPTSAAKAEVSLPTTGTYTIRLTGNSELTGSGVLVAYLGSHAAWRVSPSSTMQLVSYEIPGLPDRSSEAGIPSSHSALGAKPNAPRKGQGKESIGLASPSRKPEQRGGNGDDYFTPARRHYRPSTAEVWRPARTRAGTSGWEAGKAESPWADLAPLHDSIGTTALAGQALGINGLPLAGVQLSLEDSAVTTSTDRTGRFLLSGVPAGHQKLIVDGEAAGDGKSYGSYEVGVELANHQTTTLDYTIWLTPLDEAGDQRIDSPTKRETRLTTPRIPGLEVRIPAGTVVTDAAGHAVRKLNLSLIPIDRPPFPLPPFVSVPLYFTVQPGRAYLSKGAQIVYPNWGDLPPGQRVNFWNYDPDDRGWYVYGRGTVTPDARQVIPDPGVRVWEFTGAMVSSSPLPPNPSPPPEPEDPEEGEEREEESKKKKKGKGKAGDPVDLYTGLFTYGKTDLVLPDTMPITIERSYRPLDSNSYSFGIGTNNLYDMRLWSENNYKEADLILPDGTRIHYVRISEGTGYLDAIYRSTNSGEFFGSTITFNSSVPGWDLKLTNGYTYVFGELAPLQAIRDPYGNTLTLTRSSGQEGNVTKITSPNGRWAKLKYDESNRVTEITDNGNRKIKYTYTSGRLTKVEGLGGRTIQYEYDESGRMKAVINPRGNKYLQISYYANGRVEKQTAADSGTFEFSYKLDKSGKAETATVTDPLGRQRQVAFNAEGLPTSETEAVGTELARTTSFERQSGTGLLLSTTDPLSRKTAFEYDSNGNVKEVTRLAGTAEAQTSKYVYESGTDRVTEATDPLNHTTKYQYGAKGELLKLTDALGHEVTLEYNSEGQPTAATNAEGQTTKFSYENGDPVATTSPLGNTTSWFTDTLGRTRSVTLPGGERYLYAYNDANGPTSMTAPSGAKTTVEYDADGDPTAIIDPREGKTTIGYDPMDRVTSETDPLKQVTKFTYNKAGDLVEKVDRRGKVTIFEYDKLRRLASVKFGVSKGKSESSITYEYDKADRLVKASDSIGGNYTLTYDKLDRLAAVEGPNGTAGYKYDAANRRTLMEVPGRTVSYEYDNADRLTKLTSGTLTVTLGYDKANRLQSLTLPDGIQQLYGYDKAGQTTSIAYKKGETTLGEIDYAYDANGRTEAMWGSYARLGLPQVLTSTTYDAANQLTKREGKSFSYDADGNLTADASNKYIWDARGQLTSISGGSTASFGYDPFGRRSSKTLGGTTTKPLYDGPNVVQESVGGKVTADLLTGPDPDQLFSRTTSSGTSSYLTDVLGSTNALANSSGEVKTSYTYDPFGGVTKTGEASDNPFQFTGRENDGTGLQYNRARYYSPLMGRFISQDPAGFQGSGANLYWYANGNPVDFTDPSGESSCDVIGDWSGGGSETSSKSKWNWKKVREEAFKSAVASGAVGFIVGAGLPGGLLAAGWGAITGAAGELGAQWLTQNGHPCLAQLAGYGGVILGVGSAIRGVGGGVVRGIVGQIYH
jgi:RHS repeat-associated protein